MFLKREIYKAVTIAEKQWFSASDRRKDVMYEMDHNWTMYCNCPTGMDDRNLSATDEKHLSPIVVSDEKG